ncbi:MAG: PAS domain S-box protein [Chitinophagaceae bacterium]|nr:MAG: PAS domain S-box protein [Chitinophagaceae bacterium]
MSYHKDRSIPEERLLFILSHSPVPTAIYSGPNVMIDAANDAMLKVWGKDRSVIGKPMEEALPELLNQPFIDILKEVIRTGVDYTAKEGLVKLVVDGKLQTFYFDFIYKAVPLEDGSIVVLNTATDVTDKRESMIREQQLNTDLSGLNDQLNLSNAEYISVNAKLDEANAELQLQREILYDFFMEAPAGICIYSGPDLVVELVNRRYQMLIPGRDVLGKPLFEALPELNGQPIQELLVKVWETGQTLSQEEMLVPVLNAETNEMQDRYFTLTYQARKDAKGTITGMYGFVIEVTDQVFARKKVEQSEEHFRHLADLVPARIINALPSGEISFANKQWLDFSGLSFEDLRDFGYEQMMHPDEVAPHTKGLQQAASSGNPYISEMRFMNTDGQYIWHLNTASPVFDETGALKMWVGAATDIERLKQEEQRKSEFLNMLSHEIKTPVTTIKGYVQLLSELAGTQGPAADPLLSLSTEKLDKLILKLTILIEDMLQFGRIESGSVGIKKSTVDLNQLIASTVNDFRLIHPRYQFNLRDTFSVSMQGDGDKLGQVFTNLLNNAVKYSPGSDTVDITIFKDQDGNAAISVRDFGIGIDEAQYDKIFERFYRVEGKLENQFSGFGIGLFIADSIVKSHAGRITIESTKGAGSCFTVHLPGINN